MGELRSCKKMKKVYSPALGHKVPRCAVYTKPRTKCVRKKKVFSVKTQQYVSKCADYEKK